LGLGLQHLVLLPADRESWNAEFDGVLAASSLTDAVLELDFPRASVRLQERMPARRSACRDVRSRIEGGIPYLNVLLGWSADDTASTIVILDTGNNGGLTVGKGAAEGHETGDLGRTKVGRPLLGVASASLAAVSFIAIGDCTVHGVQASVLADSSALSGLVDGQGLIGTRVLGGFSIWLDYGQERVALVPVAHPRLDPKFPSLR